MPLKVRLKRAISILGHNFKAGIHEIPAQVEKHWYFKSLLKDGRAEIISELKKNGNDKPLPVSPAEGSVLRPAEPSVKEDDEIIEDESSESEDLIEDLEDFTGEDAPLDEEDEEEAEQAPAKSSKKPAAKKGSKRKTRK